MSDFITDSIHFQLAGQRNIFNLISSETFENTFYWVDGFK